MSEARKTFKSNPDKRHVATEPLYRQTLLKVERANSLPHDPNTPGTPTAPQQDMIRDVVVCEVGEAKGHGVHLEQAFVDKIVELGNASPVGIKARFDHPGRCETEFGWQVGVLRNFRVDGPRAVADLHLSNAAKKSPHGDLHSYILAQAEEHPDHFGNSIVFSEDYQYTYSPDGELVKEQDYYDVEVNTPFGISFSSSKNWQPEKWYVMPKALHACDVVDAPAATSGFFSRMFSQSWAKPMAHLLKNDEVKEFLKEFPKVYKALYSGANPKIDMSKIKFDINAVTETGAALLIITEGEVIEPGQQVMVVDADGNTVQAPAGEHVITESDSGQTGVIVVDDLGTIQEFRPGDVGAPTTPADPTAPMADGDTAAQLSALRKDLTTALSQLAAVQQELSDVRKAQTGFANNLKGFFTRLSRVESHVPGQPLGGAESDSRKDKKGSDVFSNPWNQEAQEMAAKGRNRG